MKQAVYEAVAYLSGLMTGVTGIILWWTGTHNCYETITGLICSRHSFDWMSAIEPWLRVIK